MNAPASSRVIVTPYGGPALDALTEAVADAKRNDPMSAVTVVVPNNLAGIVARRHLTIGTDHGPGIAALHVTTLARLAEQVATTPLHPRRPATAPVTAAAWRAALETSPGRFGKVKDHPATIRGLVEAHRELRDLTEPGLEAAAAATHLGADLVRLHRDVVARLRASWYDATDMLRTAADVIATHPEALEPLGAVVLHLPQPLSLAERELASALAARGMIVVMGRTGDVRADAPLLDSLEQLGLTVPDVASEPPTATRLLHASDADDEVRCVVREVVEALAAGVPAHRMAVLYGDTRPYARQLHEHLRAAGLRVNGPATRAVQERALARGFLGVLELAASGLPRAATFAAIAEAPTRTPNGAAPVGRWERISRLAGIVGGRDDWSRKLDRFITDQQHLIERHAASDDAWQSAIDRAEREITAAQELRAFAVHLGEQLDEGRSARTWPELAAWAVGLFGELYGSAEDLQRLPSEEQYAAVVIEQTLAGLPGLAAMESAADLTLLVEVLSLALESALPRVGRFGEGVLVAPVSAAIGLELDRVFVLGLSEDGYPGRLHEDALLNDTVRAATDGELRPVSDRLHTKGRQLLAAFQAAPIVTVSFPRGDLRKSTERLPSRFLVDTLRRLTGDDTLVASDWKRVGELESRGAVVESRSFAASVLTARQPASEQEWRLRAVEAGVPLPGPAAERHAAAVLLDRARDSAAFTRFDGNLSGVEGLPDFAHSDRLVSPTALESFASCPHAYLVRRLLGVEPAEQPEEIIQISPAEIGTLMHGALDAMITEASETDTLPSYGEAWSEAHKRRLAELAIEQAQLLVERGVAGHRRLWEPELERILADLDRLLDDDSDWRARRDAAVVTSELKFGMDGQPPVAVRVPGGTVRLRGAADKVDRTRDGVLLVTDVKSGGASSFRVIEEDPVAAGTKLQLPVYAYAARQLVAHDSSAPVEAAYWFVRRDAGTRIKVDLDEELETAYSATLGTLVGAIASGVFPPKPTKEPGYLWVACEYCTPHGHGHKEARERYELKRGAPQLAELIGLVDPDAAAAADPETDSEAP